jgi:preprotein translocase subunit SecE
MADKKKNASQTGQTSRTSQSGRAGQTRQASQMVEPKAKGVERDKELSKPSRATARERTRDERKEKSALRRETKSSSPSMVSSLRKNAIIRFVLESYYELRFKVTWPTFEEARNMTIAVLALSVVVGAILGVADFGLLHLYQLITAK